MLYFLESLIEDKSLSVEQIRKSFLEQNGRGLCNDIRLSPHTLNSIWEVAVNRASGQTQKKIVFASHGRMEKCVHCGVEHDISTMDLYTKDGRCISDMTQKEIDEYEEERRRGNFGDRPIVEPSPGDGTCKLCGGELSEPPADDKK
jgi:hypothetical protein